MWCVHLNENNSKCILNQKINLSLCNHCDFPLACVIMHCPLRPREQLDCASRLQLDDTGNFAKSFRFSPDGQRALSGMEDGTAIVANSSTDIHNLMYYLPASEKTVTPTTSSCSFTTGSKIQIGESIYDMAWLPTSSQCFASTSRDHPIVLWDVGSEEEKPRIICSYRGYDCADELEAAVSMTFNLIGDRLYAGGNRIIRCC
jgi:WD40 repeat protein